MEPELKQQLEHLYNSALTMYATSPQISSHFILRFNEVVSENEIVIATKLTPHCCSCGSLFVGGVNCKNAIERANATITGNNGPIAENSNLNAGTSDTQGFVVYDCWICKNKTKFMVQLETKKQEKVAKRSKKKKATLASLLTKNSTNPKASFSLTDFLDQDR